MLFYKNFFIVLLVYIKLAYYKTEQYDKAFELFTKSANQDDAFAQYNLGVMYEKGQGVATNKTLAKAWFGKACDNGYQKACQYR